MYVSEEEMRELVREHTDPVGGERCKIPESMGWWCSRSKGHAGPCAARPATFWKRLYWSILFKTLDVWKRIPA